MRAGKLETFIRSRRARIAVAVSLVATGFWAFKPYMVSETGGEACVNALVVAADLDWRLTETIPWAASWYGLAFALPCLAIELVGLFDAAILPAALARRSDRTLPSR